METGHIRIQLKIARCLLFWMLEDDTTFFTKYSEAELNLAKP